MTHHVRALALVTTTLLLASCAQTPPAATPAPTPSATPSATAAAGSALVGPTWLLDALAGQAPASGTSVTATFAADGTLSGSGGCNRFTGRYTATGTTIRVEDALASTMMACDEPVMAQETAFFAALTSARTFAVASEQLTLSAEGGGVVASFVAQKQELAGTAWQVTGYNNGQGAVVSVITGSTPTVNFGADGSVSGSGGCNTLRGTFTASGGTLKVGPLATTKMACAEPAGVMEQEARLVAALESAATYRVEGQRLELRTAADAIAVTLSEG